MVYPPEPHIRLLAAVARATARGITCELLSGIELQPHNVLVSLTTADLEPLLTVRGRGARPKPVDELLDTREQSGVDRWDYPLSVHCWRDRLVLRLSCKGLSKDVAVLPAAVAMMLAPSANDPMAPVYTLIDAEEFKATLKLFDE